MLKYFFYLLIIPSLLFGALKESDKQNLKNINLLKNAGFENHLATWVSSGGSFTQETISPLFGKSSAKFNAANSGEYFETPLVTIDEGMKSGTCSAYFWGKYVTGSSGDYQARLVDDSNNVIAGPIDVPVTGIEALKIPIASFKCGAVSSGQYKVRLTSTVDAGDIISDKFFLGLGEEFQISQSKIYGTAKYLGSTANCDWSTTSGALGDFAVDSDCTTPVLSGNASAPSTKIPAIKFSKLKKGKFVVQASAAFSAGSSTSGNAICSFGISDGTNVNGFASAYQVANQGVDNISSLQAVFEYASDQTDVAFRIQGKRVEGDGACYVLSSVADARELQFIVTYYPLESELALPIDKTSEHWEGTIEGANVSLATGDQLTWGVPTNSSLSMTIHSGKQNLKIPCDGGNQGTGLTCTSGNEVIGLVIPSVIAGDTYSVEYNVGQQTNLGGTTGCTTMSYWSVRETSLDGVTENQAPINSSPREDKYQGEAQSAQFTNNNKVTRDFVFNSSGDKRIEFVYQHDVSTSPCVNSNILLMDNSIANRNLKFRVYNKSKYGQQLVFPQINDALDQRIINTEVGMKSCAFFVDGSSGTPILTNDYGGCVDSITDLGVGSYQTNFTSGYWPNGSICNCNNVGGGSAFCSINSGSSLLTTNVNTVITRDTGTLIDSRLFFQCTGKQ